MMLSSGRSRLAGGRTCCDTLEVVLLLAICGGRGGRAEFGGASMEEYEGGKESRENSSTSIGGE